MNQWPFKASATIFKLAKERLTVIKVAQIVKLLTKSYMVQRNGYKLKGQWLSVVSKKRLLSIPNIPFFCKKQFNSSWV